MIEEGCGWTIFTIRWRVKEGKRLCQRISVTRRHYWYDTRSMKQIPVVSYRKTG